MPPSPVLVGLIAAAELGVLGPRGADDPVYLARLRQTQAAGIATYDTLEAIPGATPHVPLPPAAPGQRTIAPAALAAAREYAAANGSSAFMVWHCGRVETADYFGGATAKSHLISKSLAKPVAAIAVGRAIELGNIAALDEPVADFISEWRGTPKAKITVRYLLDMRAGLLPQGNSPDPTNIWNLAYLHPRHDAVIVNDYPLVAEPGVTFGYANATADLVAVLIERATGRRYAEFLSTEVFKPIGAVGGTAWIDRPGGLAHSGCCLALPAESYLRLGILLLHDGVWEGKRLLPPGYVTAMHTGTAANPNFGLGVYTALPYAPRRGFGGPNSKEKGVLHSEPYLADDLYLFDGNADQVVYIVPSHDLVILRTGASPPKTPEWDNSMLPNTILRGLTQPEPLAR
jgi:CubicO group peptidase (beta-lactamase class C family)